MTDADLFARLAQLFDFAEQGGADPAWLDATADAIVALVNHDPRRTRTLAEAQHLEALIAAACAAGYNERDAIATVRERLGLKHATFYRWRALYRDFSILARRRLQLKRRDGK